jgi:NAD(P)-dependent dehydrogenase (short-subunit alcohol dehydrogenase family)
LITGAGSGIGRAVALLAAKYGANLALADVHGPSVVSLAAEICAAGARAITIVGDVSKPAECQRIVDDAASQIGELNALICAAGLTLDRPFLKMDEPTLLSVWDTLLKGSFFSAQAFAKHATNHTSRGAARIVFFTGLAGIFGNAQQTNFSTANAAIHGLARSIAIELQKHRIYVNCVAPIAKTPMTESLPMMQGIDDLTADHVAPAALFLASDLSKELTGHVVGASGARLYTYRWVESPGRFKDEDGGVWSIDEIAANWATITQLRGG